MAHNQTMHYTDKVLNSIVACVDWLMPVVTFVLVLIIIGLGFIALKYLYRYFMQLRAQKEAQFSKRVSEINKKAQELAERWRICNNKEAELALRETNLGAQPVAPSTSYKQGAVNRPAPAIKR